MRTLFGSVFGSALRQKRKRRFVDSLLDVNEVVALQETRGNASDLDIFAQSHSRHRVAGTFLASRTAGGCLIAIQKRYITSEFWEVEVLSTGRCLMVGLDYKGQRTWLFNLHLDPAASVHDWEHTLRKIRSRMEEKKGDL